MHIIMPSFEGIGSGGDDLYFLVSVTRSIIFLFLVRTGAVLLLQKHFMLYACMFCFG
jgi:hypothetical protein